MKKPKAKRSTPTDLAAARKAAEQFLQAVTSGDEAAARALLVPVEGESMDFKSMHESTTAFELGEAKADGKQAVVEAKVQGEPGATAMTLPLVLVRAGKAWKVDMGASISRMMGGVDLEETMTQMVQGVGDAMAKGMEAVAGGLAAMSSVGGSDEGFEDIIDRVRKTALPQETAAMSEALGKALDVYVSWTSFRGSGEAADRVASMVLAQLSEAIRQAAADEGQEKLRGALERVTIRHVELPEQARCALDGGELTLEVCLVDCPGHEDARGFYYADDISDVLKQAIG